MKEFCTHTRARTLTYLVKVHYLSYTFSVYEINEVCECNWAIRWRFIISPPRNNEIREGEWNTVSTYYVIALRFIHTDKCYANYVSAAKRDAIANERRLQWPLLRTHARVCVCVCAYFGAWVREQANVWYSKIRITTFYLDRVLQYRITPKIP